jgi:diadenylate cyclase
MSLALFGPFPSESTGSLSQAFDLSHFSPLAVIDIILVAAIFYWLYTILKDTRALGIIYGIIVLVVFYFLSRVVGLDLLAFLFANFLTLLFVAIPVLFQPELRRSLERLGRSPFGRFKSWKKEDRGTIDAVTEAVQALSHDHTGAIIVLKRATGLADLASGGTKLDANVSAPLLLNIFHERAPLHDGAVIVDTNRIVAAGVMLPLSDREYGYKLGARHRAAVGLTEQCDAVVIVVSEGEGVVSLVVGGKITPGIDPAVLGDLLTELLARRKPQELVQELRQRAERNRKENGSKAKPKAKSKKR